MSIGLSRPLNSSKYSILLHMGIRNHWNVLIWLWQKFIPIVFIMENIVPHQSAFYFAIMGNAGWISGIFDCVLMSDMNLSFSRVEWSMRKFTVFTRDWLHKPTLIPHWPTFSTWSSPVEQRASKVHDRCSNLPEKMHGVDTTFISQQLIWSTSVARYDFP